MTRSEEIIEFQRQRIEALERKVEDLKAKLELENENKRLIVTELESHLSDALDQGYQFKV